MSDQTFGLTGDHLLSLRSGDDVTTGMAAGNTDAPATGAFDRAGAARTTVSTTGHGELDLCAGASATVTNTGSITGTEIGIAVNGVAAGSVSNSGLIIRREALLEIRLQVG